MTDSPLIKILLALIPVLSVTLYMLGLTYYDGFLGAYGAEPSLFPINSDITLLYGFFALGLIGIFPVSMFLLTAFCVFTLTIVVVILSSHARVRKLQAKLVSCFQKIKPSEKTSEVIDRGSTVYLYIFGVFLIVVLPYFLAIKSMERGKEQAEHNKEEFENKTGKWVMLYSTHSTVPVRAHQITCSTTHCAFWLGQETLTLAHDEIEKVLAYSSINKNSKLKSKK